MSAFFAFFKKECLAQLRSGKALLLAALFTAFGILNPAIAKLTPRLLESLSASLAEGGMTVTISEVSALDSWVQFYKNIPLALIALVLLEASVFTEEYRSGTLTLSLSKGLARSHVVAAKGGLLFLLWTLAYWLCFGITYAYNAYFWENAVAQQLALSAVCWWLFGVLVISLVTLFSALCTASSGVLLGTGGTVLFCYLVGLIPKAEKWLPTHLTSATPLIYGLAEPSAYVAALWITAAASVACFAASLPLFYKKQL